MAIKRECDRCGVQWTSPKFDQIHDDPGQWDITGDPYLGILDLNVPWITTGSSKHHDSDKIQLRMDLCQRCAREIRDFAQHRDESD